MLERLLAWTFSLTIVGIFIVTKAPAIFNDRPPAAVEQRAWVEVDGTAGCVVWGLPGEAARYRWSGACRSGKAQGDGVLQVTLIGSDAGLGPRLEGRLEDGKFEGQVRESGPQGISFVGEYRDGHKHGRGTYIWGKGPWAGHRWQGRFADGRAHGAGMWIAPDGQERDLSAPDGAWTNCPAIADCPPLP